MPSQSKVRVYIACSLDGFIAGVDDDLSWLNGSADGESDADAVGFEQFMSGVGALLMGRRTYDVVTGFPGELPYGDVPLLVVTNRPIENASSTVRKVTGTISELVEEARQIAGGKDVYLDGGSLIRQALDAGLVDDLIMTVAPQLLGQGIPLFAGLTKRQTLEFTGHHRYCGMLQIHARPCSST